jgi:hypothetical protein
MNIKPIIALSAAALILAGCSTGDANGEGATVVAAPTTQAPLPKTDEKTEAPSPEPEPEPAGTRQNPLPAGSTFELGDYTVTIGATTASPEDTQALAQDEADALYSGDLSWVQMPEEGNVVAHAPISGTYNGDQSGDPAMDLSWAYVGGSGKVHEVISMAVEPVNDLYSVGEMYGGTPFDAAISMEVPIPDVEGGVWRLGNSFSMDAEYVFVATK